MANNLDNQTAFQEKAPIFEQPLMGTVAKEVAQAEKATVKQPFHKTTKGMVIIFASALFSIIIILLILLVSLKRTMQPMVEDLKPSNQTQTTVEKTDLEKQLDSLKTNLQAADPLNQDTSYPPVDKNLTLEENQN